MLAWFVFKENFARRIFIGMLLVLASTPRSTTARPAKPLAGHMRGANSTTCGCATYSAGHRSVAHRRTVRDRSRDPGQLPDERRQILCSAQLELPPESMGAPWSETRRARRRGAGPRGAGQRLLGQLRLNHEQLPLQQAVREVEPDDIDSISSAALTSSKL